MENQDLQKADRDVITVAVDFGTTFSGAAWTWTGNPSVITVIQEWPELNDPAHGLTDEKVPTRITYGAHAKPSSWGTQIGNLEPRYQEFKLLLGRGTNQPESRLTAQYPDPLGLPLSAQFNATKLTTDYLRCIKDHILNVIGASLHEHTLWNTPISWNLTVPAIWGDKQKDLTKFCAEQAGIGKVCLMAEPEAAVFHALDIMDKSTISVGNTFVVCDCGGGTVDVITYVVESVEPLQVKELVRGDGDRCGGVYIDRAFVKYIKKRFEKCNGWSNETLEAAVDNFEKFGKRRFNDNDDYVVLRVPGLEDSTSKGIKKGKAIVPGADIRSVFEGSIVITKRLVQEQISAARGSQHPVTAVLLVGGFGQSIYLKQQLETCVGPAINVLQVKDGRIAVVRGALLKALGDQDPANATLQVLSRIARKYYGISRGIPYKEGQHDESKKYWLKVERRFYVQIAHWFVKKNAVIPAGKVEHLQYYDSWPVGQEAPRFGVSILAWDGMAGDGRGLPNYADPDLRVTQLVVNLALIPINRLDCG